MKAGDPPQSRWRRWPIWLLRLAALGVVVFVCWWQIENWRGARAWQALLRESAESGRPLTWVEWRQKQGPVIPDRDNFWATPLLKPTPERVNEIEGGGHQIVLDRSPIQKARLKAIKLPQIEAKDWKQRFSPAINLPLWARCFANLSDTNASGRVETPSAVVLNGTKIWEADLAELDEASRRSGSQLFLGSDPELSLVENGALLQRCADLLAVRCVAHLENGQIDAALADIELNERLCGKFVGAVYYSSLMSAYGLGGRMIWEGLLRHSWSPTQLKGLNAMLARRNMRDDWWRTVQLSSVTDTAELLGLLEGMPLSISR